MSKNINNYMKRCDICNLEFENSRTFSNHIRWKHKEKCFHVYENCSFCKKEIPKYLKERHESRCEENPCNVYKCKSCGKIVKGKRYSKYKNSVFCSQTCAAVYNNTHKTHGYRRSKLERWIEGQLTTLYPSLEIHFNRKDAIDSELDIYIPSLKIAFELNGIFHYEPIYSQEQFNKIQNNDQRKFQACLEKQIELCIIDTSQQKYFKIQNSEKYLNLIKEIIVKKQCNGGIV